MTDFSSPFTGPTFEIIAGPEHMSFVAHVSVLEKSEKLKAMIHGEWKDSLEGKIVLEDWDAATVGRMLEWLYTSDYKVSYPEVPELDPAFENKQAWFTHVYASPMRALTSPASLQFNKLEPPDKPTEAEAFETLIQDSGLLRHKIDYELTLMSHAKVYVFADYMLLPDLQAFSFQRLQKLLSTISPIKQDSPVISNLIALVDYVYANTSRSPGDGEESLQKLITTFIALNFSQFKDKGRKAWRLMDRNGKFARAVLDKVQRNIADLEKELEDTKASLQKAKQELERGFETRTVLYAERLRDPSLDDLQVGP